MFGVGGGSRNIVFLLLFFFFLTLLALFFLLSLVNKAHSTATQTSKCFKKYIKKNKETNRSVLVPSIISVLP
jgi:hypothetical protein